jgi:hypothetical protein
MKPLEPPATIHVSAAEGWLMLGCPDEAERDLGRIAADARSHPDVLGVRCELCVARGDWAGCFTIAQEMLKLVPANVGPWIQPEPRSRKRVALSKGLWA